MNDAEEEQKKKPSRMQVRMEKHVKDLKQKRADVLMQIRKREAAKEANKLLASMEEINTRVGPNAHVAQTKTKTQPDAQRNMRRRKTIARWEGERQGKENVGGHRSRTRGGQRLFPKRAEEGLLEAARALAEENQRLEDNRREDEMCRKAAWDAKEEDLARGRAELDAERQAMAEERERFQQLQQEHLKTVQQAEEGAIIPRTGGKLQAAAEENAVLRKQWAELSTRLEGLMATDKIDGCDAPTAAAAAAAAAVGTIYGVPIAINNQEEEPCAGSSEQSGEADENKQESKPRRRRKKVVRRRFSVPSSTSSNLEAGAAVRRSSECSERGYFRSKPLPQKPKKVPKGMKARTAGTRAKRATGAVVKAKGKKKRGDWPENAPAQAPVLLQPLPRSGGKGNTRAERQVREFGNEQQSVLEEAVASATTPTNIQSLPATPYTPFDDTEQPEQPATPYTPFDDADSDASTPTADEPCAATAAPKTPPRRRSPAFDVLLARHQQWEKRLEVQNDDAPHQTTAPAHREEQIVADVLNAATDRSKAATPTTTPPLATPDAPYTPCSDFGSDAFTPYSTSLGTPCRTQNSGTSRPGSITKTPSSAPYTPYSATSSVGAASAYSMSFDFEEGGE
jgi:hypothetical protein